MTVHFSPQAVEDFKRVLSIIALKWGEQSAKKLEKAIFREVELIKKFPEAYPILEGNSLSRKCIIMRKTIMIYQLRGGIIEIMAIHDAREDF